MVEINLFDEARKQPLGKTVWAPCGMHSSVAPECNHCLVATIANLCRILDKRYLMAAIDEMESAEKPKTAKDEGIESLTLIKISTPDYAIKRCISCDTKETVTWWKCCPKHTTQRGGDVVCDICAHKLHPEWASPLMKGI